MNSAHRWFRWAVALALVAGGAGAQVLYPNGEFEDADGVEGWTSVVGTVFANSEDAGGCPDSGSLYGLGDSHPPLPSFLELVGPCASWPEGGTARVDFDYESLAGPAPGTIDFFLRAYSDADCVNATGAEAGLFAFDNFPWAHFQGTLVVPPGGSIRMHVDGGCDGTCGALLDQLRVTSASHVFVESFEGGGSCRWSSSVESAAVRSGVGTRLSGRGEPRRGAP